MKIKKWIKSILKISLAGLIALLFLNIFCMIYKNEPIHYPDPDGATDYRWAPDSFHSQATEGFSYGKTNNEGYYSIRDYHEGDETDILILGSSQMEAAQVMPEDSTAAVLDREMSDSTVYNIGTSGHTFLVCACNLEKALKKYNPLCYVVMQTDTLKFPEKKLQEAIDGLIPEIESHAGGIVGKLQKIQYFRWIYHQYTTLTEKNQADDIPDQKSVDSQKDTGSGNVKLLTQLLTTMNEKVTRFGARLIILYNPGVSVHPDGSMSTGGDPVVVTAFKSICDGQGILFLDMSKRFEEEYKRNYSLPYGFNNTPVGNGHLNKQGHAMIADELYKLLQEVR